LVQVVAQAQSMELAQTVPTLFLVLLPHLVVVVVRMVVVLQTQVDLEAVVDMLNLEVQAHLVRVMLVVVA
jgi:hypothetical protein